MLPTLIVQDLVTLLLLGNECRANSKKAATTYAGARGITIVGGRGTL